MSSQQKSVVTRSHCPMNKQLDMRRVLSYSVGCMMGRFSLNTDARTFATVCPNAIKLSPKELPVATNDGILTINESTWIDHSDAATNSQSRRSCMAIKA